MSTITHDQITAINALDKLGLLDATIARRIMGETAPESAPTIAPVPVPTRTVQRTQTAPTIDKSADKTAWMLRDPSGAQLARIARAEEAILESGRKRGAKLVLKGAERDMAIGTAGAASRYYKSLATFTAKHAIKF